MATVLDIGILQNVQVIFPFLLVLVFVWAAFMTRVAFFKDKPAFAAIVAVILALMAASSRIMVKTIGLMGPWFVLFILFGMFMILTYQSLGVKGETIENLFNKSEYASSLAYWVLAISLLIGLGSLFSVIAEEGGGIPGPGGTIPTVNASQPTQGTQVYQQASAAGGQSGAFWNTLFHPKVLGLAVILLIAMFTVQNLGDPVSGGGGDKK